MIDNVKGTKAMETKVERYEVASDGETGIVKPVQESAAMGTVTITDLNEIFLIPAPSADPRGMSSAALIRPRDFLTVFNRSVESLQVPQDIVHCARLDLLQSGTCAGLRFWRSSDMVHPYLCRSWSHVWSVPLNFILAAHLLTPAADITALMTYPSMFMGVGNLVCMPLALAIGRRPVYLLSLLILIGSSVWAAYAKDYNEHLGARML